MKIKVPLAHPATTVAWLAFVDELPLPLVIWYDEAVLAITAGPLVEDEALEPFPGGSAVIEIIVDGMGSLIRETRTCPRDGGTMIS